MTTDIETSTHDGFTLIELLVVVLIIGILVAIAVPKFMGASRGARDKAAQTNLRAAESLASSIYTNGGAHFGASIASDLPTADRWLTWTASPSTGPTEVSYVVGTGTGGDQVLGLATRSGNGDCYYVVIDNRASGNGTRYGKTTGAPTCSAAVAPTGLTTALTGAPDTGWQ